MEEFYPQSASTETVLSSLVYGSTKDVCLESAMEQKPGPAGTAFQWKEDYLNVHEKEEKRGKTKNVKDDGKKPKQKNVH